MKALAWLALALGMVLLYTLLVCLCNAMADVLLTALDPRTRAR